MKTLSWDEIKVGQKVYVKLWDGSVEACSVTEKHDHLKVIMCEMEDPGSIWHAAMVTRDDIDTGIVTLSLREDWVLSRDLIEYEHYEIYENGHHRGRFKFHGAGPATGTFYFGEMDEIQISPKMMATGAWKFRGVGKGTVPTMPAADVVYGVKCGKCNEWCPDAEAIPGFKCYRCRGGR